MSDATLVLIKPDAVDKGMVVDLLLMFEYEGFLIERYREVVTTKELLENHYSEHKGKSFFNGLISAMVDKPIIAVVQKVQCGKDAIKTGREVVSRIRTKFLEPGYFGPYNLVHASDSDESALREIKVWFGPREVDNE